SPDVLLRTIELEFNHSYHLVNATLGLIHPGAEDPTEIGGEGRQKELLKFKGERAQMLEYPEGKRGGKEGLGQERVDESEKTLEQGVEQQGKEEKPREQSNRLKEEWRKREI
ncbi:hypothetical protein AMTR_s00020p00246490, partial [Amborella trichopoda]